MCGRQNLHLPRRNRHRTYFPCDCDWDMSRSGDSESSKKLSQGLVLESSLKAYITQDCSNEGKHMNFRVTTSPTSPTISPIRLKNLLWTRFILQLSDQVYGVINKSSYIIK